MSNLIKKLEYMYKLHKRNAKIYFKPILTPKNEPLITNSIHWIGHSTILINLYNKILVTDPVTSLSLGHLKRLIRPSKNLSGIKLDYILLSHCHMDHLNFSTLRKLNKDAVVFCPKNSVYPLKLLGFKKIHALSPNEEFKYKDISIKTLEANHDGRRYYLGKESKSNSYLIKEKSKSIFFAGDTAYTNEYKNLKADIALMPVGCYKPNEFQKMHCSPEQSFKMFKMMNSKTMIPIHYKTYILAQDSDLETYEILKRLNDGSIKFLDIGETINI
ncbi:metal-dependent hydrolase [Clostridium acetireducens DSM 10703]|jgi:L-ascorbate metabolism protein UlaG (beta-lactamase superfamily)|uniref:Metal-dependent hydrolase n=1 Tax=Clostridium acetireducens DSM 10703 TaxID=1121290 RepID=A0A1E8F0S5_9CLOT|nr:MBL fold metallo-hydrolase [Clostridium acetireducens]OFI07015.1 metal-dependent hydrolase [Clostridium acetireducens DSM 10703]